VSADLETFTATGLNANAPSRYTPDVSLIVDLEDTDVLDSYFAALLIPAKDGGFPASAIDVVRPPPVETTTPHAQMERKTLYHDTVEPPNVSVM
jgi:hypothetical protein